MSRGKEGKIRTGLDETSSLLMAHNLSYIDVTAIVYDILTTNKASLSEEERERLRDASMQLKKVTTTSKKLKTDFNDFLDFAIKEIASSLKLRKSQMYDENGYIRLCDSAMQKIDSSYIRSLLLRFYQEERVMDEETYKLHLEGDYKHENDIED